ncbi:MAG: LLM class flavin-dependent oxidoreductase [Mycobacteriales bacterium]
MQLGIRFDLRSAPFGASLPDLYAAAADMAQWADELGFDIVYFAEHHGADDGFCPTPMLPAAMAAARTARAQIRISALLAPLHHPLQTAEELAVLDVISRGRAAATLGLGYRPVEFGMRGVEMSARARLLERAVHVYRQAWTGEPFEFEGKAALVRPRPVRGGGPRLYLAGTKPASARRAAALGLDYEPGPSYFADSPLYELYEAECARLGRPAPAPYAKPGPRFLFVTHDPERDWERLFPFLAHQTNSYAQWRVEANCDTGTMQWTPVETSAQLRADRAFAIVTPEECLAMCRSLGARSALDFYPLTGGIAPELAWHGLRCFADEVLPELRRLGLVDRAPLTKSG